MGASAARGGRQAVVAHQDIDARAVVAHAAAMVRRRSPPASSPPSDPLPPGWQWHDGSGCPVAPDDRPAVWMRSGTRSALGARAASQWQGWDGRRAGSCWIWEGDSFDILAFRCEDAPPPDM